MESSPNKTLEILYVIVNYGLGSKVLNVAKQNGISGGTVYLGKGTIKNRILEFLDLNDVQKEIVLMVADKATADDAIAKLNKEFKFYKPNHGVAFSISVGCVLGSRSCLRDSKICRGEDKIMYQAIFVIVDKGKAENVIEAATQAGSRGGTIINARGSGVHETSKVFSMNIEPEKEIVLILSKCNKADTIISSIRQNLRIDEPGNGIIFVQEVNQTYGLYDE